MTNILIVGANGFIGSNLTRDLINEDNEISIITKNNSKIRINTHKYLYINIQERTKQIFHN